MNSLTSPSNYLPNGARKPIYGTCVVEKLNLKTSSMDIYSMYIYLS